MPDQRKGVLLATVAMFALLTLAACWSAPKANTIQSTETTQLEVEAQDFALTSLSGETVRLADYEDRWVVINFWATWCAPCREEMPLLEEIAIEYGDRVQIIGINMRESEEQVRDFVDAMGVTYPILLEPDDETLLAYQVIGLPVTWIVAPGGKVAYARPGPIDEAIVLNTIGY